MRTRTLLRLSATAAGLACCLALLVVHDSGPSASSASARHSADSRDTTTASVLVAPTNPTELRRTMLESSAARMEPQAPSDLAPTLAIEIVVLRDEQPACGESVACFRDTDEPSGFLFGESLGPAIAAATTDRAGVVRFAGLSNGRYGIAVGGERESACRSVVLLSGEPALVRVVIERGASGLEGRVFGYDGRPASGFRVLARQAAPHGQCDAWFSERTDESGGYRIRGLAGGEDHGVYAMVDELVLGSAPWFVVAKGEWRQLDFGSPEGRAHWSGTVRLASGDAIDGMQRLCFTSQDQRIQHDGYFGAHGRFDVHLPGGTYAARLASADGVLLGVVEVHGETKQDLHVPGATLHGRVTYIGTKHPFAHGPEREVRIVLERADGARIPPSLIRGEATYSFCALSPGDYVLTTQPWPLANTADGKILIHVDAARSEIVLDVEITDG